MNSQCACALIIIGGLYMLKIVRPICCGIDVHNKFIVATIASTDSKGVTTYQTKEFKTFNWDLNNFKAWLAKNNCTEICMESTGKYWIPIFNVLEESCKITLANPKYVKALSGKKTDKKDSRWISDLFKHDLVPGSYIPPKEIRMLRDLCRYENKLIGNRSSEKNRVQNSLTVSNIALANVVSDSFGKTASKIIDYILSCETFDVEHCKTLIDSRMKATPDEIIKSILGYNLSLAQVSKIKISKEHLGSVEKCLDHLHESIHELAKPYEAQIKILISLPGMKEKAATKMIAEIGVDMSVFKTSKHLCSWAGLTPQNNESAGKKKSSKISRAGVYLKPLLVQCANAAIKSTENPYFRDKYLKIKKRRGHKKAIIAIARMMLTCIYHMLSKGELFAPSDFNYSDLPPVIYEKRKDKMVQSAIALLQKQGFTIMNATDNDALPNCS